MCHLFITLISAKPIRLIVSGHRGKNTHLGLILLALTSAVSVPNCLKQIPPITYFVFPEFFNIRVLYVQLPLADVSPVLLSDIVLVVLHLRSRQHPVSDFISPHRHPDKNVAALQKLSHQVVAEKHRPAPVR